MLVLAVSHSSAPWGAERRLLDLAPALREHDVTLCLAAPPGELAVTWRRLGLDHVETPPLSTAGLRRDDGRRAGPVAMAGQLGRTVAAAVRIRRLAREVGADLLHAHALNAHMEVALASKLSRTPAVLDLHDIVVPGLGRRLLDV